MRSARVRHQQLGVNEKLLSMPSVGNFQAKVKRNEQNVSQNVNQQPLLDCPDSFSRTEASQKKSLVSLRCFGPTSEHDKTVTVSVLPKHLGLLSLVLVSAALSAA